MKNNINFFAITSDKIKLNITNYLRTEDKNNLALVSKEWKYIVDENKHETAHKNALSVGKKVALLNFILFILVGIFSVYATNNKTSKLEFNWMDISLRYGVGLVLAVAVSIGYGFIGYKLAMCSKNPSSDILNLPASSIDKQKLNILTDVVIETASPLINESTSLLTR